MDEAEYDIKNYADRGGCYPPNPKTEVHILLRGAVERGPDMYSKETYEMLKGDVAGGPSIVFTRYNEVGVTKIRDHLVENPRLCTNILGYDANALYLLSALRDMPCGKEKVVQYSEENKAAAGRIISYSSWM